jgi:hypothetical protein
MYIDPATFHCQGIHPVGIAREIAAVTIVER